MAGDTLLDGLINRSTLRVAHSTEDGAHGLVRACLEPGARDGGFFGPAGVGQPGPAVSLDPAPERSAEAEKLLWDMSVAATGAKLWGGGGAA